MAWGLEAVLLFLHDSGLVIIKELVLRGEILSAEQDTDRS